jgi:PAS domain S-box-containing protein
VITFTLILSSLSILWMVVIYKYFHQEFTRRSDAEQELRQQTERERLVHEIARQVREFLDLDHVMATTVREVQRFLKADRVLIYRLWDNGTGCAIHEAVLSPYAKVLGQEFPPEVFPREYHKAYSLGKIRTITNIDQSDVAPCLAEFVKQFSVKAKLVVPIIQENPLDPSLASHPYLWGLLIAHQCHHPRQWEAWEIELMRHLATQVAIGIQQSELYIQLQHLNTQLEHRVQQRTSELEAANRALRLEIAQRQRTEIALRHSNDTLQALVTASPRAILMLDPEGQVKIWNPAAEQMFGWTEAELLNHPSPIPLDEPLEDSTTLKKSVLQGKTFTQVELRCHRKNGTLIDIIFSAAPLLDSNGKISGLVAVIANITEQKQNAELLRLLQSVVVNTNDSVIITEAEIHEPRILYVNEAFTRITGYTPEEVLGKTPRILQGSKTDQKELDKVRGALSRWESITVEVINYRKDGSEFWNEFNLFPVANAKGCYTHWIAVQRDTTARKRADEIRLALEREKELNSLKTRFFSMASHEFRTPLSTALAAAQVLENSQDTWDDTEKRLRNLRRIQDSVKNMVQLLDDILTISRAEAGSLTFNPKPLDLKDYCYHFIEDMRLSAGTKHSLVFNCLGESKPVSLDETLLHSILSNLLSNAIKYSPHGGIVSLTVEFHPSTVTLRVQDQGIGIPLEDQKQLFEPFHRGKNVRTIPGTGLGLVVVKKCIDLHQGHIQIMTEVGKGTTCWVVFPL